MGLESKYVHDKNLQFFQEADARDLKVLANLLIKDCDGMEHLTGELKKRMHAEDVPDEDSFYTENWRAIAAELQLFGGNTILNTFRRQGVYYEEIVHAVAKRVGVDFYKEIDIEKLEERILRKLFGRITTMDDLDAINEALKVKGYLGIPSLRTEPVNTIFSSVTKQGPSALAVFAATRIFSLPIATTTSIISASSPAYRITIPCVCIVAMMRKKHAELEANTQKNSIKATDAPTEA